MSKPRDKVLKQRLRDDPADVEAIVESTRLLLDANRLKDAERLIVDGLARVPGDPRLHLVRAEFLAASGRDDEACLAIDEAEKLGAPAWTCARSRADSFANLGMSDEATAEYDKALAEGPRDVDTLCAAAGHAQDLGAFERALAFYTEASAAAPDDTDALLGVADTLFGLERFDRARFTYERVLGIDPENEDAIMAMSETFAEVDRLDDALKTLEDFVLEYPKAELPLRVLARLYLENSYFDDAEATFRRLTRLPGGAAEDHLSLAMILEMRRDSRGALEHARRALSLAPLWEEPRLLIGSILFAAGKFDEAERQLREALRTEPRSAPAMAWLALALQARSSDTEARAMLAQAIEQGGDDQDVLLLAARIETAYGETERACELSRAAVEIDPRSDCARLDYISRLISAGKFKLAETECAAYADDCPAPVAALLETLRARAESAETRPEATT